MNSFEHRNNSDRLFNFIGWLILLPVYSLAGRLDTQSTHNLLEPHSHHHQRTKERSKTPSHPSLESQSQINHQSIPIMSEQTRTSSNATSEPVLCKNGCGFFVSKLAYSSMCRTDFSITKITDSRRVSSSSSMRGSWNEHLLASGCTAT